MPVAEPGYRPKKAADRHCPPPVMARWVRHLSRAGLVVGDGDLDDRPTLAPIAITALETHLTATVSAARLPVR